MDQNEMSEDRAYRARVHGWLRDNPPAQRPRWLPGKQAWRRKLSDAGAGEIRKNCFRECVPGAPKVVRAKLLARP